jgi:hypothetical protein
MYLITKKHPIFGYPLLDATEQLETLLQNSQNSNTGTMNQMTHI